MPLAAFALMINDKEDLIGVYMVQFVIFFDEGLCYWPYPA